MNIIRMKPTRNLILREFPNIKNAKTIKGGEDALLFEKSNIIYRFTIPKKKEDAIREIDVCGAASRAGLFPMIEMPEYFEDTGILKITMENLDGDMNKLSGMSGMDKPKLDRAINELIKSFHNTGYCHGDISPENIMYKKIGDNEYRLYLIDFTRSSKLNKNSCRDPVNNKPPNAPRKSGTRVKPVEFTHGNPIRFSPIKNYGTPTSNSGTPESPVGGLLKTSRINKVEQ